MLFNDDVPEHEELRDLIEEVADSPSGEMRMRLYNCMLECGPLLVPVTRDVDSQLPPFPKSEGAPFVEFLATTSPDGFPAGMAFTDEDALTARCGPTSFVVIDTLEALDWVVGNEFAGLVLNPAGPWAYLPREHISAMLGSHTEQHVNLVERGKMYMELGLDRDALRAFQQAIETSPDEVLGWLHCGYYYDSKDYFEEAQRCFARVCELDESHEEGRLCLAEAYYGAGEFDKARESALPLLEASPDDVNLHYFFALSSMAVGFYLDAASSFKRVVEQIPEDSAAWLNFGTCCHLLRRSKEAIDAFEHSLALEPDSVMALVNLGLCHADQGNEEQAEIFYKQALEIDREYALAHYNLACLYSRQQEVIAAVESLRFACELSSDFVSMAKDEDAFDALSSMDEFQQIISGK